VDDTANAYKPVVFDIVVTEYMQPDGTILTEKVTTRSNGTRVVERTTYVKKSVIDECSAEFVETGVAAGINDSARPPVAGEGSHTGQASSSTDDLGEDVKKDN
jgi:hypothetical protein